MNSQVTALTSHGLTEEEKIAAHMFAVQTQVPCGPDGPMVEALNAYGRLLLARLYTLWYQIQMDGTAGSPGSQSGYRQLLRVFCDLFPIAGQDDSIEVWDRFIKSNMDAALRSQLAPTSPSPQS